MQLLVLMEIRTIGRPSAEIEGSRSESDGTIPFGDHAFDRTSGRIRYLVQILKPIFLHSCKDKFTVGLACIQQIQISVKQKIIKFCCI